MVTGYIVRHKSNPHLVYCTNGEFIYEDCVGPGHEIGAKVYKRKSAAQKVLGGHVIVEESRPNGNYKK